MEAGYGIDVEFHYINESVFEHSFSNRPQSQSNDNIKMENENVSDDDYHDREENGELYDEFMSEGPYVNESVLDNSLSPRLESKSNDKSLHRDSIREHGVTNDDNSEKDDELYDDYMYDRDYEGYKFSFQKLNQRKTAATARNAPLIDKSILQKILIFALSWLLCMLLVLFIDRAVCL